MWYASPERLAVARSRTLPHEPRAERGGNNVEVSMRVPRSRQEVVLRLEQLEHALARGLIELSGRLPSAIQARTAHVVEGARLHPEVQLLLAARRLYGRDGFRAQSPAVARARMRREARVHQGPLVPVPAVWERSFEGPGSALRARHYVPRASGARPLLVFFHGGGFVAGDLDTHDAPCRVLCRELDAHVLSVDYRLAPEHPFPAAVDDALAALRFARESAAGWGADPARIALCGDSAGANLAAVASLLAARAGEPLPALQLLVYPTVDSTRVWPSLELFAEGYLLTRADIEWFRMNYARGHDLADPRISPLLAPDLSGLPPAVIVTAGFDPLRDEGEAYAEALRQAGNEVVLYRAPGLIHGFLHLGSLSPAARAALSRIVEMARARLGD